MANQYYFTIYEDGSTGWAFMENQPVLSQPGTFVTYAEYSQAYLINREAEYQRILDSLEADVTRTSQVRDAYVTMGVPLATANIMSGYTGAVTSRDQHIADHDSFVTVRPSADQVEAGVPA
jgi:hypothetical protein